MRPHGHAPTRACAHTGMRPHGHAPSRACAHTGMRPHQLPLTSIGGHEKKDDVTEVLISRKRSTMANSDVRNRKASEPTPELIKQHYS